MEREDLLQHLAERPGALSVVRHAHNALRYYRLSITDLPSLLRQCVTTAETHSGRTNVLCSLADGTQWCITVKIEGDELVVITIIDKTPGHRRTPRSRR